ncbi:YhgE/Pip family protein [Pediococcus pentosaceus]|uniref:YhgE/Pip family protein n=1 Tax=Pediococcus pentosaceus TaxID=1255 RepID=UPI00399D0CD9
MDHHKLLTGGLNQLNGQIPALVGGVQQLDSGSHTLNSGLQTLNGSTGTLISGVQQLDSGSHTLNDGLQTLNGSTGELIDGVNKLNAGASELDANSDQLLDGSKQISDGNGTLADSLEKGSKQVNSVPLTSKTAQMFAAPTHLKQTDYSYVPNYGHALAPYVLSLALYVGAIVFNFAYPIRKISKRGGTATDWFLSKVSVGTAVALGMALIEATIMMVAGIHVDHVGQYYLTAIMIALTSMYIVMFLSMAFDNPGRFVAMILLMLQLGGSGGTFPMEVTNSFYNAIHPFLPLTYSILSFRQSITSGLGNITVVQSMGALLLFAIIALALLWFSMVQLQKKHLEGKSQLDDNQKLQEVER